jgi:hypothetical protein
MKPPVYINVGKNSSEMNIDKTLIAGCNFLENNVSKSILRQAKKAVPVRNFKGSAGMVRLSDGDWSRNHANNISIVTPVKAVIRARL